MKFKASVSVLALSASSSAFALMMPPTETKTICLSTYDFDDGSTQASTCDEAKNNRTLGLEILENGCAEGQVALVARKYNGRFDVTVRSCLPPSVVQL